jgi:hypothetical protein
MMALAETTEVFFFERSASALNFAHLKSRRLKKCAQRSNKISGHTLFLKYVCITIA